MTPNVPLIAWAPDTDPTRPGVMTDVENMAPTMRGYSGSGDLIDPVVGSATMVNPPIGAGFVEFANVQSAMYAGTTDKVYQLGTFASDISRASPAYNSVTVGYGWRFSSYGDDMYVTQYLNGLQKQTGGAFALTDVSGAPGANTICRQSEFIMLGHINGTGWDFADGWWCSARTDPDDWTLDVATQCVRGRLTQTPGRIVRLVAFGNYILAFKPTSILRGTYVGTPAVWRWDVVSTSVGLVGHDALCEAEGVLYWLGNNGFYRFDGGGIQRLESAPWQWWRNDTAAVNYDEYTLSHYDPARRIVRWHYVSAARPNTAPITLCDAGIAYHPQTDRWSRFTSDVYAALNNVYDYGANDTTTNNVFANSPAVVIDSTYSTKVYGAFTSSASFTTGDVGDDDEVRAMIRARLRFLKAPSTASMTHYHRMNLSDSLQTGETVTRDDGRYDVTHSARWHRFKFTHSGAHEVLGFSVDVRGAGRR